MHAREVGDELFDWSPIKLNEIMKMINLSEPEPTGIEWHRGAWLFTAFRQQIAELWASIGVSQSIAEEALARLTSKLVWTAARRPRSISWLLARITVQSIVRCCLTFLGRVGHGVRRDELKVLNHNHAVSE
jgi:hypothetical protein